MKVLIKKFDVDMNIKNKGIELEVRNPSGTHLGDLVVTKTKLTWCEGQTIPKNGIDIEWVTFIKMMNDL